MSVIKHIGRNKDVPSVCVSVANFHSYVAKLLTERQHRVEVWDTNKNARGGWECVRRGSPGNLEGFEDVIFDGAGESQDTPTAVCVQITNDGQAEGWRVGMAYCDNTLKHLGVTEFIDSEHLNTLEAVLVRLGAKECIVADDKMRAPVEGAKIRDVLDRCDVVLTERKRTDFNAKDIEQDLERLLGDQHKFLHQHSEGSKNALSAAACLIKYLDLMADDETHGKFKFRAFAADGHMKLDSAAMRALNLLPQPGDASKNMSLYGLLNKCRTSIGSRLLLRWLKQPLLNKADLEARLDLVEVFVEDHQLRQGMQERFLRHVPDLARMSRKFQAKTRATLQDAWRLYQFVQQMTPMREALEECAESLGGGERGDLFRASLVDPLADLESSFKDYEQLVEQSLDLDGLDEHEYRINPRYDEELGELAEEKARIKVDIDSEQRRAARKLNLPEDKVKLERNKGIYSFRITRKDEKILRKDPAFSVVDTKKDGVKFTCKDLKPLAEAYKRVDDEYNSKQAHLVAKVIDVISTYSPAVDDLCKIVAEIDVLVSFAHVSTSAATPYVRPTLSEPGTGDLVLMAARHPCVESMDDVHFIANDIELRRDKGLLQIVTGPNMGGKSTYIRQAGVIVLMAQIGCFVPCDEAEVSICSAIFARVGASDNQQRGVSTFMSEMLETAAILDAADSKSLIIIDELGRGTSTYDGFGLAWAISEHIATKIRAPCLFATHFHELTELSDSVETVSNRHVTAQVTGGALTMLYQVNEGPCDESFGIHVAEMAKFPEHVIEMARRKAQELEHFSSTETVEGEDAEHTVKKRRKEDG
eukprot:CAMPEP_0114149132 /NCGR_PEP_ID=MMETSP0043_2-20121206/21994_1 /TAXON_ID=464988 /ORGANISM="Hemiselmis andersenii, Strain CCMP644" /LENGTH=815 /DNA_ID=CAMNT_0001243751 /DNA_START=95 /DNA_END=2539 /DNA_ORIENTATION=+